MRLKPGIHTDVPMAAYIADPSEVPSLNATAAHLLVSRSSLHAWFNAPRLNPNHQAESSNAADIGSVAHHILLAGDTRDIAIVEADDWRTKAAKEQREEAYARGAIPILARKMDEVRAMVDAAKAQIEASELGNMLAAGGPELTLIYEESGTFFRSRPDWWTTDRKILFDLKTTQASAEPNSWIRLLLGSGYDLQAEIALRAASALQHVSAHFVFGVLEQEPPYAMSFIGVSPQMREYAGRKLDYAAVLWRNCLDKDRWPGYPQRICWAEVPQYHAQSVEELIELGTQA